MTKSDTVRKRLAQPWLEIASIGREGEAHVVGGDVDHHSGSHLVLLGFVLQQLWSKSQDGDGAQGGGDEDGQDGQGEDLLPQRLPLSSSVLEGVVQEDGTQGSLDSGLWHPGKGHEDLLPGVQVAAGDSEEGANHADGKGAKEDDDSQTDLGRVDLVHLDLCPDEGKDDWLEDDPHLGERVGHRVVVAPALPPPLHGGHKGQNDSGEPSSTIVVDQVGAVQGY